MPTLTKDLSPETKNLAPWLDFRLYVADQCFRADKRHAEMVRAALGNVPIGIDGFTSSSHVIPYGGVDIGRLLAEKVFDFYCPYGDDLMIASMVQGPMVKYIGWAQPRTVYFGQPWRDAFRGHWGTFRFFGPTFFSQFGWTQPSGRWMAEGTREFRGGVGKLLMGARRQLGPVAILYSAPSLIATAGAGIWVEKGNAHRMWRPANWSRAAFGYAQRTSDSLVGVTEDDSMAPRTGWWVGEWFEKGLKVTDGKGLGKHWFLAVPALVVKQTGKGRALLLNFRSTAATSRSLAGRRRA